MIRDSAFFLGAALFVLAVAWRSIHWIRNYNRCSALRRALGSALDKANRDLVIMQDHATDARRQRLASLNHPAPKGFTHQQHTVLAWRDQKEQIR